MAILSKMIFTFSIVPGESNWTFSVGFENWILKSTQKFKKMKLTMAKTTLKREKNEKIFPTGLELHYKIIFI